MAKYEDFLLWFNLDVYSTYRYHGPQKPTSLEVLMVNDLVFRWPKPLFFMVLVAHGTYSMHGSCMILLDVTCHFRVWFLKLMIFGKQW